MCVCNKCGKSFSKRSPLPQPLWFGMSQLRLASKNVGIIIIQSPWFWFCFSFISEIQIGYEGARERA